MEFFQDINDIWGITNVTFKGKATFLKYGFLGALAQVLSDYRQFWTGERLYIKQDYKRKLATFPLNDPTVMQLGSIGRDTNLVLKRLLIDHLNKGRRTGRLVNRYEAPAKELKAAEVEEEE